MPPNTRTTSDGFQIASSSHLIYGEKNQEDKQRNRPSWQKAVPPTASGSAPKPNPKRAELSLPSEHWYPARDTVTGSSGTSFSKGWPEQQAAGGASPTFPSEGSSPFTSPGGQAGPASRPEGEADKLASSPQSSRTETHQKAPPVVFHDSLLSLSLASLANPLPNYIKCKLEKK